jgi:hypothetical protein
MAGSFIATALTIGLVIASPSPLDKRTECVACNPAGIKSSVPPAVGPDLARLYGDLVSSVKGIHFKRSAAPSGQKAGDSPICCTYLCVCQSLITQAVCRRPEHAMRSYGRFWYPFLLCELFQWQL